MLARCARPWPRFRRCHILCATSAAGVVAAHRAKCTFMETRDRVDTQRLHLSVDGSTPQPVGRLGKADFANGHASGRVAFFSRSTPQDESQGFAFDGRNVECGMLLELSPRRALDDCEVFVGIQIPGRMPLTWTTRWASKIVLSFCSTWAPIHTSVGGHSGREEEYAHIVVPWSNTPCVLDRFEVAPHNGEFAILKPGYTYTWEFGSTFVDLSNWRLVNLPVLGNFPLKTLWGDLPLEFVVYAVPQGGRHLVKDMRYLANVQLSLMDCQ